MERDAQFAQRKAERATFRSHFRDKYRLPKVRPRGGAGAGTPPNCGAGMGHTGGTTQGGHRLQIPKPKAHSPKKTSLPLALQPPSHHQPPDPEGRTPPHAPPAPQFLLFAPSPARQSRPRAGLPAPQPHAEPALRPPGWMSQLLASLAPPRFHEPDSYFGPSAPPAILSQQFNQRPFSRSWTCQQRPAPSPLLSEPLGGNALNGAGIILGREGQLSQKRFIFFGYRWHKAPHCFLHPLERRGISSQGIFLLPKRSEAGKERRRFSPGGERGFVQLRAPILLLPPHAPDVPSTATSP